MYYNIGALPGVFGEHRKKGFISGELGNKGQILRGTGEQRQSWKTGTIKKANFYFWGTREQAKLFQGNKCPCPLGGPNVAEKAYCKAGLVPITCNN